MAAFPYSHYPEMHDNTNFSEGSEPNLPPGYYSDGSAPNNNNNLYAPTANIFQPPQTTLVTGILLSIMLVLFILLCYLTIPLAMEIIQSKMPVSIVKKERRLLTIEGWLITKKARACCDTCQEVQRQYKAASRQGKIQLSPSYDTAETQPMRDFDEVSVDEVDCGRECAVCMDRFKENEVVSWSPTVECGHVFHHECIKEWLVFHDNCPYCRVTVLPVDDLKLKTGSGLVSSSRGNAELTALAKKRTQRARATYFCIDEGLVTVDKAIPSTMEARKHRRFLGSRIKQGELCNLRGNRSTGDESSGSPRNVTILPSPVSTDSTDSDAVEITIQ